MGKRKQTENKSSLEIVEIFLWGNAGGGGIVFASGHGTDGHSEGGTVAAAEPEQGDLGQILPLGDEESGPASLHALAAAWPLPTWQSLAKPPMELHLPMPAPCQHMETRAMQKWVVGGQLNLNPPGSPAQAG